MRRVPELPAADKEKRERRGDQEARQVPSGETSAVPGPSSPARQKTQVVPATRSPSSALREGFAHRRLAGRHARFHVILRDVVTLAFAARRFLPLRLFFASRGRKSNCGPLPPS